MNKILAIITTAAALALAGAASAEQLLPGTYRYEYKSDTGTKYDCIGDRTYTMRVDNSEARRTDGGNLTLELAADGSVSGSLRGEAIGTLPPETFWRGQATSATTAQGRRDYAGFCRGTWSMTRIGD